MASAGEEEAGGGCSRVMRIYVGGVSASVTAADMEKTFSLLGRVAGVEFVRTDCRSFAFMDFEPTSDRHLAKLFSTYNGCTWKGGKLKLEKAKEHYLTRLKREWAEDAELLPTTAVNLIADKNAGHLKRSELLKQENMQLQLFFPKLRKVKSLPFKGTGKHKYSFQRIEVPSLPVHFCDCEEHWDPSEKAKDKCFSSLNKVIQEKELHTMNSVMSKLFGREDAETDKGVINLARDASISDPSIEDIHSEDAEEAKGLDADNLVTNIGTGGKGCMLMQLDGWKTPSVGEESRHGNLPPLKDGSTQNKADSRKRKKSEATGTLEVTSNKKDHPILADKSAEDEFTPILPRNMSSIGHSQGPEIFANALPVKSQTEPNMDSLQSRKPKSWLQKSSWKDLVGKMGNNSFSISNVLPGKSSTLSEKVKTNDSVIAISTSAKKKRKPQSDVQETNPLPVKDNVPLDMPFDLHHLEESEEGDGIQANPEGGHREASENDDAVPKCTVVPTGASAVMPDKRVHPKLVDQTTENEDTPILTCRFEGHSQEPDVFSEAPHIKSQAELDMDNVQSRKGSSWIQKSSWKDLVGVSGNSSFSISNVLPGINMAQNLEKTSWSNTAISTAVKNRNVQSDGGKSNPVQVMQDITLEKAAELPHVVESEGANPEGGYREALPKRPSIAKVGISGVCPFMRSAESEKEWTRAKAALSGYIKKKGFEKEIQK